MTIEGDPIVLLRCQVCGHLNADIDINQNNEGLCRKCGAHKFYGGSPRNLIEWIKCWIWAFTLHRRNDEL